MEHILVGVDLSESSEVALGLALKLSRPARAAVRVVFVIPPLSSGGMGPGYIVLPESIDASLQQQFTDFLDARLERQDLKPGMHYALRVDGPIGSSATVIDLLHSEAHGAALPDDPEASCRSLFAAFL